MKVHRQPQSLRKVCCGAVVVNSDSDSLCGWLSVIMTEVSKGDAIMAPSVVRAADYLTNKAGNATEDAALVVSPEVFWMSPEGLRLRCIKKYCYFCTG